MFDDEFFMQLAPEQIERGLPAKPGPPDRYLGGCFISCRSRFRADAGRAVPDTTGKNVVPEKLQR
jgi:hypothetical protein